MAEGEVSLKLELAVSSMFDAGKVLTGQESEMFGLGSFWSKDRNYYRPRLLDRHGRNIRAVNALRKNLGIMHLVPEYLDPSYEAPPGVNPYLTVPLAQLDVVSGETIADPYPLDPHFEITEELFRLFHFREELRGFKQHIYNDDPTVNFNNFRNGGVYVLATLREKNLVSHVSAAEAHEYGDVWDIPIACLQGWDREDVALMREDFGVMVATPEHFRYEDGTPVQQLVVVPLLPFDQIMGDILHPLIPPEGMEIIDDYDAKT